MNTFTIYNTTIVTPAGVIENASLTVKDGIIIAIDRDNALFDNVTYTINANGAMVIPGIIDIHTDALDAEIIPRPGADIPIAIAFRELERKMSGCGFTTVYHSLHLGYEVAETNSKSKYSRTEVFDQVYRSAQGHTLLNNKIHLRFEVSGVNAYDTCFELIDKGYVAMLSVMDHTPGQGQYTKALFMSRMQKDGKTEEQALTAFETLTSRPKIEGEKLKTLIDYATQRGIPIASHDDDTVDKVNQMYALGIRLCEFPINIETAAYATKLGMHVIGGASNILRGGSLTGNLNIKEAVLNGTVDTLCSDYYPPSILHAVFKLHLENGLPLHETVNLATLHPARAAKIDKVTGSIETGKEADLLIVNHINGIPMVTHTIVKGNIVSQAAFKSQHENLEPIF